MRRGASGLLGGHLFLMEKYDRNMRRGASGLLGGAFVGNREIC